LADALLNYAGNEFFGQSTTAALTEPRRPLSHSGASFIFRRQPRHVDRQQAGSKNQDCPASALWFDSRRTPTERRRRGEAVAYTCRQPQTLPNQNPV